MVISVYLAKVMGLYFVLSSIALLIFRERFKKLFKEVASTHFFINFTGFLSLIIGLLIVVAHNYWMDNWPTLITIIGWLILIQGFLRIYFPKCFIDCNKKLLQSNSGLLWLGWGILIVGIYLTYIGFSYDYYGF